jgi:hypothetical protein
MDLNPLKGAGMKKLLILLLVILHSSFMLSRLALAEDCPELKRSLKEKIFDNADYRIASLGTFPQSLQAKILEKTNNHCPNLIQLDPSVEAFGVVVQDKNSQHYHVLHVVKCDCKGGPGWRITKFAEFSDDIPIISSVTEEDYIDSLTNERIPVGIQWKAVSIELLNGGEKYLYKRHNRKSVKYKLKEDHSKLLKIASVP